METASDSPLIDSPSARKRKRFAGIWDGVNVNAYMDLGAEKETGPPEKRARIDKCLPDEAGEMMEEEKEGVKSASVSPGACYIPSHFQVQEQRAVGQK